ncbi:glutathione peroxidase [Listeria monocytogenes]|uniref:Glutathione peroxidase n=3 Tax=Listeria monocytogenes TaxID=1639 RepID=A0A9P1YQ89_LISMN|nr:glutathione peroxidase [Listeria monocytogenes]EAD5039005.1 glutathione peroxidase [Listeria monocytogenes serotype 1/2a]EAE6022205.1 glutathione peroxidase [Listeria monocytogenes serotype 3a]EAG6282750.1 glutathione peroxidase [Listeria monocytogenes CFSAN003810]EAH4128942.1 glutathione peroxidase [Listeria monocytogenes LIS0077]MCY48786.1 glutathione peroxidase [Listeria monocytogenes serotype 4b]
MNVHDFSEKAMNGKEIALSDYEGKVLLIVNTASKCGLTPQLEGLEAMYKKLGGDNFEILGFPCNQFLRQDPGSDEEILEFCQMNYGVTFQMFSKIKVKGKDASPLYKYLTEQTGGKKVEWNFAKFLIDENGEVIERFPSKMKPEDFEDKVEALVAKVNN